MNNAEFIAISRLLKGAFPFSFQSDDAISAWFNNLSDLNGDDVMRAVKEYTLEESTAPTIAVIRARAKAIAKQRDSLINNLHKEREYRCAKCKDTGWTFWISPTGLEMAEPCKCEAGQRTFYAKSDEERQRILAEEPRRGQRVSEPMRASLEFYMEQVFGKKVTDV